MLVDGDRISVVRVRRVDMRRRRRVRGVDLAGAGKKSLKRVGAAFDGFDTTSFDGSEVDDTTVGGRDLWYAIVSMRGYIASQGKSLASRASAMGRAPRFSRRMKNSLILRYSRKSDGSHSSRWTPKMYE